MVGGEAPAGVVAFEVLVDRVDVPPGSAPREHLDGEVWKLDTPTYPTTMAPMARTARLVTGHRERRAWSGSRRRPPEPA